MTNPTNDQLDRHIAERVMGYAVHEYRKDEGWAAAIADIEPDDYPLIVLAESTIMQRLWCSGIPPPNTGPPPPASRMRGKRWANTGKLGERDTAQSASFATSRGCLRCR
jgi:hypothetical protein